MSRLLLLSIFIFTSFFIYSESTKIDLTLTQEIIYSTSEESTPHYLISNKNGNIENEKFQSLTTLNFNKMFNTKMDYLSYELGLSTGLNIDTTPQFHINELYGQINFYSLSLFLGKKEHTLGSNPVELSSGSMIISNNASPIPRINIGIFEYTPIPYTKNIIHIKGNLAHGWFEGNRYVNDTVLHEKSLYLKFETKTGLYPYAGIVHEAIWGNSSYMDMNLENYFRIFVATNGGEDSLETDQINRLGNHLGMYDFGIYGNYPSINFQLYYQHFFEDGSGKDFMNKFDGLWGLVAKTKKIEFIDSVLVEFLTTEFQSGDAHDKDGVMIGGLDSYYNNSVYQNGWTHLNHIIGNSFFSTSGEDEYTRVSNNRMHVINFGITGNINRINYTLQTAYAQYFPAYGAVPKYTKEEYMWYIFSNVKYKGFIVDYLDMELGLEYDFGSAENTFGARVAFNLTL